MKYNISLPMSIGIRLILVILLISLPLVTAAEGKSGIVRTQATGSGIELFVQKMNGIAQKDAVVIHSEKEGGIKITESEMRRGARGAGTPSRVPTRRPPATIPANDDVVTHPDTLTATVSHSKRGTWITSSGLGLEVADGLSIDRLEWYLYQNSGRLQLRRSGTGDFTDHWNRGDDKQLTITVDGTDVSFSPLATASWYSNWGINDEAQRSVMDGIATGDTFSLTITDRSVREPLSEESTDNSVTVIASVSDSDRGSWLTNTGLGIAIADDLSIDRLDWYLYQNSGRLQLRRSGTGDFTDHWNRGDSMRITITVDGTDVSFSPLATHERWSNWGINDEAQRSVMDGIATGDTFTFTIEEVTVTDNREDTSEETKNHDDSSHDHEEHMHQEEEGDETEHDTTIKHDGHGHTHPHPFNPEPKKEAPITASHRVSFSGVTDQSVVVTVRDSSGNIVDTVEGEDDVQFTNLDVDEEYTVTAETKGHCGTPQTISDVDGEETIISFEKIEEDIYTYRWESDLKNREYECSSHVVEEKEIVFLEENPHVPNIAPAHVLEKEYNILLSNEGLTWSSSHARGLLRVVSSIPHRKISTKSFVLTGEEIEHDIRVRGNTVYLSKQAFNHVNPRMVTLDGRRGSLFSHRLFHALVRFYTNNGTDRRATDKILKEKFGVNVRAHDTYGLTGEHADNFQAFKSEELLDLISALAETPEGLYKIPGLTYILRRKDGHPHPLYPGAPAVAWPRGPHADSYIEFMETAFYSPEGKKKASKSYIHRLILHEKSHFLWRNVMSKSLRQAWIDAAGWYQNDDDSDGWSNKYTTGFVSPYAHAINPNEDLAETFADYITNPNKVRNVSPEKYEFIRRNIMHGSEYVLSIREDLRFEVLNLFPDYDYPGKIRGLSVTARGAPDENKRVTIEIELNNVEGYNDGAHWALTRLRSKSGLFRDMYMYPVSGDKHRLRGTVTIPKHTESGYWNIDQIVVKDLSGNTRTEGIVDFGFMLYINNAVVDSTAPKYVPESLNIVVEDAEREGRHVHKVTATWDIIEDMGMKENNGVYANFVSLSNPEAYSWGSYGRVKNNKAKVIFYITEYYPSGKYTINYLNMTDKALNRGYQKFSNNPKHEKQKIFIVETANPDTVMPTLDVNRISVDAVPFNKERPDGKTRVTVTYYAKDDKSGVGKSFYVLQDPHGNTYSVSHYHKNFHSLFFKGGDPTVYKKYVATYILPVGSVPGIWGLREMVIEDKGGNIGTFNFAEILHFELEEGAEV